MQTIFTDTLEQAFAQAGLDMPQVNGKRMTRFSTDGSKHDRAGWLIQFDDHTGATFGDWRTGNAWCWQQASGVDELTPADRAAIKAKAEKARKEAEQQRDSDYAEAAEKASDYLGQMELASSHPYLEKKHVRACGTFTNGEMLVVPVYGQDGLQSLQSIEADGTKRFMPGGKMKGGFFIIGEESETIVVCEGFATGASIHEATGDQVYVAFTAGNLKAVANVVRSRHHGAVIVIAGDEDATGRKNAEEAAKAVGGAAVFPVGVNDFNDMALAQGIEAVAASISGAFRVRSSGYMTADELSKRKRMGWRVKDMVPRKGLCTVWGPPGSGKSFFVLDLSCAIALGKPDYHGKRIRPGVVIYMAMEGNLQDRVDAYKKRHGIKDGELNNLLIKHSTVNFMDVTEVQAECAAIKDAIGDREVALVVIDTLARSMPGGNENGSEHMGAVIGGYKIVEDYFNTCVMPLHHCGKNVDNGMRGHSSLLGAIDAEIEIKRNNADPVRTLHVGKQKDGMDHYDLFNFKLDYVELGPTRRWDADAADDEMDGSCVVLPTDEVASTRPKEERTTRNGSMLQRAVENARAVTGDIQKEDVRVQFYLLHKGTADAKKMAFRRDWQKYMNSVCDAANQAADDRNM